MPAEAKEATNKPNVNISLIRWNARFKEGNYGEIQNRNGGPPTLFAHCILSVPMEDGFPEEIKIRIPYDERAIVDGFEKGDNVVLTVALCTKNSEIALQFRGLELAR